MSSSFAGVRVQPLPQLPEPSAISSSRRRSRLTEREVWNACDTLVARGEGITMRLVHEVLQQRGSLSTVTKFVNTWKDRRADADPSAALPPRTAPDHLRESLELVWERARDDVRRELQAERDALATARAELDERHHQDQQELAATRQANAQLQSMIDRLADRFGALETTIKAQGREQAKALKDVADSIAGNRH